jgi:hypothetical protein
MRRYVQASSSLIFLNISKELHLFKFLSFLLGQKDQTLTLKLRPTSQAPADGCQCRRKSQEK